MAKNPNLARENPKVRHNNGHVRRVSTCYKLFECVCVCDSISTTVTTSVTSGLVGILVLSRQKNPNFHECFASKLGRHNASVEIWASSIVYGEALRASRPRVWVGCLRASGL